MARPAQAHRLEERHAGERRASMSDLPVWKELEAHAQRLRAVHLRRLFADDARRGERFTAEAAGLYLDYSKNRIDGETLRLLFRLAEERGLRARIDAMFRGEKINTTEQRAVLHTALRAPKDERIVVDGVDVVPEVHAVLDRMAAFSSRSAAATGSATPASASATSST